MQKCDPDMKAMQKLLIFVEKAAIHSLCGSEKCRYSYFVNCFFIYLCIYAAEKTGLLSPMGPLKSGKWN